MTSETETPDEAIIPGDLFISEGTFIRDQWVRKKHYDWAKSLAETHAARLRDALSEIHSLREQLRREQPPIIAQVIERRGDVDLVKMVISSHWSPEGIRVIIAP
jgi:hypothetical protein